MSYSSGKVIAKWQRKIGKVMTLGLTSLKHASKPEPEVVRISDGKIP